VASRDALRGRVGRLRRCGRRAAVAVLVQFAVERGLLQDGLRRVFVRFRPCSLSHLDRVDCWMLDGWYV